MMMINKNRLRPKARTVDYVFVVHLEGKLGRKRIGVLNKGGASDDCKSIQESF